MQFEDAPPIMRETYRRYCANTAMMPHKMNWFDWFCAHKSLYITEKEKPEVICNEIDRIKVLSKKINAA